MQKVFHSIDTITEWTGKIFRWTLIALTLVMMFEVLTRYAFHRPTIWAFEVSTGLYALSFMMCGAYALLYKAHVSIDIIYEILSPKVRSILDIISHIVFFYPFIITLIIVGTKYAAEAWKIKETHWGVFPMPLYIIKTAIPAFAILTFLQGTVNFLKAVLLLVTGKVYDTVYKKDDVKQIVKDELGMTTDPTASCIPVAENAADQGSSKTATISIILRFLIVIAIAVVIIMLGI